MPGERSLTVNRRLGGWVGGWMDRWMDEGLWAREDGGVSGVSSSCGARGGFLPRHDEDLREPLVRRQGSQVSIPWTEEPGGL